MDFKLHQIGLIQYEIEEIIQSLDIAMFISLKYEQNTIRYNKIRSIKNRLETFLIELEVKND
jgi:hypothetical protein